MLRILFFIMCILEIWNIEPGIYRLDQYTNLKLGLGRLFMNFYIHDIGDQQMIDAKVYYVGEPMLEKLAQKNPWCNGFLPDRYIADVLHVPADEYRKKLCSGIAEQNINLVDLGSEDARTRYATTFRRLEDAQQALSNVKNMQWYEI